MLKGFFVVIIEKKKLCLIINFAWFSDDNYKVGCDWSRIAFSSDGNRIAAGSADGSIFIWDINGRLEANLKEHS